MVLYRAFDKAGKTVDFILSLTRDVNAAKTFLRKAMAGQRIPTKIPLDTYATSHRAVIHLQGRGELPKRVRVRTSKLPEQHPRTGPPASETKAWSDARIEELPNRGDRHRGIELAEKIKKGQFKIGKLPWPLSRTLSHFNSTKPSHFGLILNLHQNQFT
jgi:hypothetical protein